MKKNYRRLIGIGVFIGLIIAVRVLGYDKYLTFEMFKNYRNVLIGYVNANYLFSVLIYILLYIIAVALSIPGATILTLAGGFLFSYVGVLYVNIGATVGAVIVFILARYLLGNWIHEKYGDKLTKFNNDIATHGHNYLLTLRFIPVFPFFAINLFAGITKISLFTFFWTTMFGIIPGSFVYVYAGTQLGKIDSLKGILSFQVIMAFVLLGVLALIPVVVKKFIKKK